MNGYRKGVTSANALDTNLLNVLLPVGNVQKNTPTAENFRFSEISSASQNGHRKDPTSIIDANPLLPPPISSSSIRFAVLSDYANQPPLLNGNTDKLTANLDLNKSAAESIPVESSQPLQLIPIPTQTTPCLSPEISSLVIEDTHLPHTHNQSSAQPPIENSTAQPPTLPISINPQQISVEQPLLSGSRHGSKKSIMKRGNNSVTATSHGNGVNEASALAAKYLSFGGRSPIPQSSKLK